VKSALRARFASIEPRTKYPIGSSLKVFVRLRESLVSLLDSLIELSRSNDI
jgi:hypothetical protein